jgi:ribosomal protein L37E
MMEIQQPELCACCMHTYDTTTVFCNHCGYPLQGTKKQQDDYIANRTVKEIDLAGLNKKIETASNSLYWIAGIFAVSTVFSFFRTADGADLSLFLITSILLIGAFLAFAIWSKTKPAAALISGLSLYLIVQILNAVDNPLSIVSGIIFKIFIIAYLIKGILAVLEVEKIKKELNIK